MNIVEKAIYCYEYLFYKEYVCFECGNNFRMKKHEKDEYIYFMPACSNSCLMSLLSSETNKLTNDFIQKYGNNWKIEYVKYLKNPINHHLNHDEKMEMIKSGEIDEYGNKI